MHSNKELNMINAIVMRAEQDILDKAGKRVRLILAPAVQKSDFGEIDPYDLLTVVANALGFCFSDYVKDSRQTDLVDLRKIGTYLVRTYLPNITLKATGRLIQKDHTTVIHYMEQMGNHFGKNERDVLDKYDTALNAVTQWLAGE